MTDFSGIYPPIVTPFKNDRVDAAGIRHNVERLMTTGLRGLLALGSNGEAVFLDEDEAELVVATAREHVPRDRVLLAGTGRQSTRATIAATTRAARAGADAVLVLTPSYFKSHMTHEALVAHYTAVADSSPVPVLLYNFTAVTALNLGVDTVATMSEHPNVVGLKDSNGDIGQVSAVVARVPEAFTVLVGSAGTLHPAMVAGAKGGIIAVANVVPDICVRLYDLVISGRHDEARVLQRRLTPLAKAVTSGYLIAGLKAAMDMAGYVGGEVRGPLRPIGADARQHLAVLLKDIGAVV
ncbi:MAG: dihydrodipicolinate synthase family protein [Acidobacteriota bacterium]